MAKLDDDIHFLYNVVKKLNGSIQPVGSTHCDDDRFEYLQVLCGLVSALLTDIDTVATDNKDRPEFSMNRAGKFADEFLDEMGIKE